MKSFTSKILNSLIPVLALALLSPTAFAKTEKAVAGAKKVCPETLGTDLPFLKGRELEIVKYIPETLSYKAVAPNAPDEGIADVTLESLASGVTAVKDNYDSIVENPTKIVGSIYMSFKDVPSLTEPELAARKGCVRK